MAWSSSLVWFSGVEVGCVMVWFCETDRFGGSVRVGVEEVGVACVVWSPSVVARLGFMGGEVWLQGWSFGVCSMDVVRSGVSNPKAAVQAHVWPSTGKRKESSRRAELVR